jgi:putative transposase
MSTIAPTPTQVYRYAVQAFQPYVKLSNTKGVAAETLLTVLFAVAARINSLSDTCQRLRGVRDEHVVAEALYSTLPEYDRLRRRVQAALLGPLPKALRRRPQVIAIDLTLLPYYFYGADRRRTSISSAARPRRGRARSTAMPAPTWSTSAGATPWR